MRGGAQIIPKSRIETITAAALAVLILDLVTKAIITRWLFHGEAVPAIPGLLNIVYYRNPGAAFGIFNDGDVLRRVFLIGTSVVALAVIGVLLRGTKSALTLFALSLVAGGAVGNLIDRVRFGTVVDFLDFHIGRYHWPAFNVADSAITIGVILAVYSYYFTRDGA